jgi:hypothetical protein
MLTRLTDGLGNVTFLKWTSDSRYIMHYSSARSDCSPGCGTYYIVGLEGKPAREILPDYCGYDAYPVGWIGPTKVLCTGGEWEERLVMYDLLTGDQTTVLEYMPDSLAVDPESGMVLAGISDQEQTPGRTPGYYLLDPQAGTSKRLPMESYCPDPKKDDPPYIEGISFGKFRFHISCTSGSVFVDLQGTPAFLPDLRFEFISYSPNQERLLGAGGAGKLYVISSDLKLEHELTVKFKEKVNSLYEMISPYVYEYSEKIDRIFWRSDGDGFFYQSNLGLTYVNADTGETKLVDPNAGLVLGWTMKE